ncbi:hypothetical protein FHX08_000143 [Rhizobium sp. BK529]|nr:hypothetical protein [Rhizobium sp. BK529]TCS04467.1 hypothetical protein EV281_103140 [Rhizobium sp. BK418]
MAARTGLIIWFPIKARLGKNAHHWKNAAAAYKINGSGRLRWRRDNALVIALMTLNPCFATLICIWT